MAKTSILTKLKKRYYGRKFMKAGQKVIYINGQYESAMDELQMYLAALANMKKDDLDSIEREKSLSIQINELKFEIDIIQEEMDEALELYNLYHRKMAE